ncbi:MAG TPA: site-specific integrase, partial [Terriglobales bacterium]|nr:site-specific integrase [Terriglobales bacterium]
RKAWGFTAQINGRQVRRYKAEWTQDDAEAELAKALLKMEPENPQRVSITLAQAIERYLASKVRKRTINEDRRQLDLLKAEFGGEAPLVEITASRISEYKAKRLATVQKVGEGEAAVERRLTAAAVNRPLALLRHLLRLAHEEWEAIDNIPRIRLEKEPQGRLRWLTQEEITRLLEACAKSKNKQLRAAVVVALNTGLRRGELMGLTWNRVDLSRGVIRLELTKSGRRREVPMNDDSYQGLVSLGPKADGRVFKTRYIQTAYNNAVAAARLDDVNFHTLRHTFASWAVMRGVTLKELQELLGHASLAMTMRYAHLAPEHLRTAVSRLAGLASSESTSVSAQASAQEPVEIARALQNSLK